MGSESATAWGQAIEALLRRAQCSRRKAAQRRLAPYSAFSQWKTSQNGPSVAVLDRLLRGLGLTWHDWAQVFESLPISHSDRQPRARKQTNRKPVPSSGSQALRLVK